MEELRPVFQKLYKKRFNATVEEKGIKNIELARNMIEFDCSDIFEQLHISKDRYHCRATLMSYKTQLELLGFSEPFKRS